MAPKENGFSEENDDVIEPILFVPPTISTLSIIDLPSVKHISCYRRFSGTIYTLAASLLFTCAAFSLKILDVDMLDGLLLRFALQTIFTLIFALYKNYSLLPGTMNQIFLQFFCVTTGAGNVFIYFVAVSYVELSDVTTLYYTRVVWTVLFGIFINRERPAIGLLLAIPLTLVGVAFVAQPSFLFTSKSSPMGQFRALGLILSLVSSFASAANVLSFKQLISISKEIKPSVINLQYCFALLILLIINQFYRKFILHTGLTLAYVISWKYLLASFVCLTMIIANILTQKAMQREHPAVFTLLTSADIIFSLILQNIFTSKKSNLFALLGSALVIGSVVIIGVSKMMADRHIEKETKLLDHEPIKKHSEEKC
jgi:drug/metabolite transporter (DMT)-like permease